MKFNFNGETIFCDMTRYEKIKYDVLSQSLKAFTIHFSSFLHFTTLRVKGRQYQVA